MKSLVISSLPLLQLTLHAYEMSYFALATTLPFEKSAERIKAIKDECAELDKMIEHTKSVIKANI